jgi:hypothetical protein
MNLPLNSAASFPGQQRTAVELAEILLVPRQPISANPPEDSIDGTGRDDDHPDLDTSPAPALISREPRGCC